MPEDFTITLARKDDVPKLEALVNSAYRGESSRKGWTTEADFLDGIRTNQDVLTGMVSRGDSVVLKWTDWENKLLGCVYLQKKEEKIYLGMSVVR